MVNVNELQNLILFSIGHSFILRIWLFMIICKDMSYMYRWMENYLGLLIRRNKCIIKCSLSTEFEGK